MRGITGPDQPDAQFIMRAETGLPRLRSDLRQFLNLSPEITLLEEGELPRAPGKAVRVVDRR